MNPAKHLVENRSVLLIYRDCLKLLARMLDDSYKVQAARLLLRREFEKNKDEFDTQKIHAMKMK